MSDENPQKRPVKLQVQIDEKVAQGQYCNLMMLNHTETEFVMDFVFVQPGQPKAKVSSRVITSPQHAKQLLMALTENIGLYEQKHGPIKIPGPAKQGKLVH
jgi:hypothetical protein